MAGKNKKVRLALIGCGDISGTYLNYCQKSSATELVAVMDVNLEAARRIERKHGIPATGSYKEILADPAIDAVLISVPHYLHASLTLQAARAGKHVLCDKPIATKLADAKKMIAVCRQQGVTLSVLFPMRTRGLAQYARELIRRRVIGDIIMVNYRGCGIKRDSYWTSGYTGAVKTDWRGSKEKSGGGFMMMNLSHTFDLVRYVTGLEVASVSAEFDTMATPVEVEDVGAALVRYSNGAIGNFSGGSIMVGTPPSEREPIRIYGTHGQLHLPDGIFHAPLRVYTTKTGKEFRRNSWHDISGYELKDRSINIVDEFSRRLLRGAEPFVSGHDGLVTLEAILGLYASGKSGRTVRMKTGPGPQNAK